MTASIVASFTGTNTAGSSTQSSQTGDIFLAAAYRDGSSTLPTTPSGWTNITSSSGGSNCIRIASITATGTTTDIAGTWTNATSIIIIQFRGTSIAIGNSAVSTGTDTPVVYNAVTLTDSTSNVVGFVGHRAANLTDVETPPTGMTFIVSAIDATDSEAAHWTNGEVSSWSSQNVTVGSSSNWHSAVIELRETGGGAFTVTADGGSYSISGTAASPEFGRLVSAATASYSISGTAASLLHKYHMTAGGGSYAVTGADATLLNKQVLAADGGSYAISGADAGLTKTIPMSANGGTYSISGTNASLMQGYLVAANTAAYAVSGAAANLERGYLLTANGSSYAVIGTAASVLHAWRVTADGGTYSINGSDATLTKTGNTIVAADSGVYTISGSDATLIYTPTGGSPSGIDPPLRRRRR